MKIKTTMNQKHLVPSAVANPISHQPLRRTGSFAAATITAALAIWATTSSNVLQSLLLSLSYAIHRTQWGCRWSTVHRKQLYQRSPAHPAPHAPSLPPSPPSRAPPPPSRRSRTRHPPASATTTSGKVTQAHATRPYCESIETTVAPGCKSSSKYRRPQDTSSPSQARRRRRRRQNSPRRRRRRRRERRSQYLPEASRRCRDVSQRPSVAVAASPPQLLLLLPPRHRHRQHSRWSWSLRQSRSLVDHPRTSPRKCANWSAVVAKIAGWSSIAPLEGRGSRGR